MSSTEPTYTLLYDPVQRRPGCVLLQAVAGADMAFFNEVFGGADNWIINMTPGLRRVTATRAEWEAEIRDARPVT
jgi:hypothetical protein